LGHVSGSYLVQSQGPAPTPFLSLRLDTQRSMLGAADFPHVWFLPPCSFRDPTSKHRSVYGLLTRTVQLWCSARLHLQVAIFGARSTVSVSSVAVHCQQHGSTLSAVQQCSVRSVNPTQSSHAYVIRSYVILTKMKDMNITNSVYQSPFEKLLVSPQSRNIPILLKSKLHFRVYNSPLLFRVPS